MVNTSRFRGLGVIGVTGLVLCGLSDSRPASAGDLKDYVNSQVPQEVMNLAGDAADIAGAYTGITAAIDVANTFAQMVGILSAPTDKVAQEFDQLNQHLDAIAGALSWQMSAIDRENRLANAEADVVDANQIVQATGQPLPITSAAELDSIQQVYQAETDVAFERYFYERATDGATEQTGTPYPAKWKSYVWDRPTVTNGVVYDWRFGVPALMRAIELRIQVMAAVDPNFRTSGRFTQELIVHRNALLSQIAKMNDGVRCADWLGDVDLDNFSQDHHPVCADIYTGTAAFGVPVINEAPPHSTDTAWLQANIQPTLNRLRQEVLAQMPLRQMYALAKSLLTYENIPGELLLTGGFGWDTIGVAASDGAGGFTPKGITLADFATFAQSAGVSAIRGDFDRDGRADIALLGVPGWQSIPVAFDNGDGTFRYTNTYMPDFPGFSSQTGVKPVGGDFNGDGFADIALVGGPWWQSIPVALGNGDGSFSLRNEYLDTFPDWSATVGAIPVSGDFNNDGLSDIALVGPSGWHTIPIAFSNGDSGATFACMGTYPVRFARACSTFSWTNAPVDSFPYWASLPNVQPVAGDFNGDGTTDIALVGQGWPGWPSTPVAFSVGDTNGSFAVDNASSAFAWLGGGNSPGFVAVGDDFNNDGIGDIAVTGYSRSLISLGLSNSDGTFSLGLPSVDSFPVWATYAGAIVVGSAHPGQRR